MLDTVQEFVYSLVELSNNQPYKGSRFLRVEHSYRVCPDCEARMKMRRIEYTYGSIWHCRRGHRFETDGTKTPILQQRHVTRTEKRRSPSEA